MKAWQWVFLPCSAVCGFAAAVTQVVDGDVQVSVVTWSAIITSRQAISHEGEKAEDNRATTPPTTTQP